MKKAKKAGKRHLPNYPLSNYYLSFPDLENQNRHFLKVKNVTDFSYIYFINFSLNDIIRLLKNNIIFILIL
jgi:hypothetical protein